MKSKIKMRIGIVTYHRALNYGACLQAIATRQVLTNLGHEVYFLDYWPEYHKRLYTVFSLKRFFSLGMRSRWFYLLDRIKNYKNIKLKISNYENFFKQYVYPYCKPEDYEFDVIVYGSDQIWRKQEGIRTYNPVYFGRNDFRAKKHIAYSASMGILPDKKSDKDIVYTLVKHLDRVAVREENLKELLCSMGVNDVELTLDPTLLIKSNEWDILVPNKPLVDNSYVLVYGISNVVFNMEEIQHFAKDKGLSVVVLKGNVDGKDSTTMFSSVTPIEFISLIKNADFVFTSSFHGLAFSIIYEREFLSCYSTNSNRAQTLLNALGLGDRIIAKSDSIPNSLSKIDYCEVGRRLGKLREKSISYLTNI